LHAALGNRNYLFNRPCGIDGKGRRDTVIDSGHALIRSRQPSDLRL
jgi:hypothetical protein